MSWKSCLCGDPRDVVDAAAIEVAAHLPAVGLRRQTGFGQARSSSRQPGCRQGVELLEGLPVMSVTSIRKYMQL